MKVALTFPGCHRRGGVERVMVECANFLHAQGHEVTVYASEWDAGVLDLDVKHRHVPAGRRHPLLRLLSFNRLAPRALRQAGATPEVVGAFGILAAEDAVVWVQAVHRAWMEVSCRRSLLGRLKQRCNLYHPLVLALERRVYGGRRYRKLIALSEQVKADLMRFYGVPEEDIVLIPNGFAPSEFNVPRAARHRAGMRERLGYGPNDRVVIFVANELERKGFGPLLRALASLQDSRVRLLAVGRLNARAYEAEIARLGMAGHVRFAGPSADVASFYAAADVFALPTQYEAWGLVITEAMACGLPVLTSRLAGAAVAVQEGVSGSLLDDPSDVGEIAAKIRPLLDGRHAPADDIADSVAEYAWPQILRRYEAVLQQCASSAPVRSVEARRGGPL